MATVATGIPGRSFFQDVGIGAAPGQTWVYSAWVRSASGRPISAQMTLWALGGTQEAGSTQFTADGNWTLVSAPVSVTTGGHTTLRSELYLNTVNENLQVDGAQLVNTGLANSSWELAYFSGWDTYPFGAPAAAVSRHGRPRRHGPRLGRGRRRGARVHAVARRARRRGRATCSPRGCARRRTSRSRAR